MKKYPLPDPKIVQIEGDPQKFLVDATISRRGEWLRDEDGNPTFDYVFHPLAIRLTPPPLTIVSSLKSGTECDVRVIYSDPESIYISRECASLALKEVRRFLDPKKSILGRKHYIRFNNQTLSGTLWRNVCIFLAWDAWNTEKASIKVRANELEVWMNSLLYHALAPGAPSEPFRPVAGTLPLVTPKSLARFAEKHGLVLMSR